ncbi:hypothetical protein FRC01_011674, partial [Tulasnella sp. 417]
GKDPKWNRCPICFDSVNESHLKCVRWDSPSSTPSYQEFETPAAASSSASGSSSTTLKMRLVERPHITTMALPRSHFWPSDLLPPHQAPFHFLPDVQTFAKFMLATPAYLISNLSLELEQLEQEKRLLTGPFPDDVGLNYVLAAEEKVRQQMGKAAALEDASPGLARGIENARKLMEDMEKTHEIREKAKAKAAAQRKDDDSAAVSETPSEMLALQSSGGLNASSSAPTPTPRGPKPRKNVNPAPPPSASSYFFYQAANGAPLFLHPLDSRILLSHFKSYSDLPDEIEFPTTTVSYIASTINDEVRKRYKYLSHLPEAADVVFVETGWELEGIVGAEGLKPFEGALKLRHGKRKEKERKEERARVRAEERERDEQLREMSTWIGGGYARSTSPARMEREESPSPPPPPLPSSRSSQSQAPTPQPTGVWGNRSFASAIRAPAASSAPQQQRQRNNNREPEADDEWEHAIDEAWRELEMSSLGKEKGGAGRGKKKGGGKKLVILSSSGSGRGRY